MPTSPEKPQRTKKDLRFYLILLSLCLTLLLTALEFTSTSTALPTIVSDLHGQDFVWVGSAYALSSSAVIPLTGGLAEIFGRRPSFLGSIVFFAVGSALCGAAKNMNMLIAGRTVQGLGAGGIFSLVTIIIGDMVSLQERGLYAGGYFGSTWGIAITMGLVVGGSLASQGQWRWLFYLNLPLCGLSASLAIILLKLPTPPGKLWEKFSRMDWIGNFILMAATCSTTIALTLGGVNEPWASARILAPLTIGLVGLGFFIIYEALWASCSLVPFYILSNRTSLSGYIQVFLLPVTSLGVLYYIPVYFQACKDADAIRSGVLTLGLASIGGTAVIGGVSVKLFKAYRPQIWIGWSLQLIGVSLLTLIKENTVSGMAVGCCVIFGFGAGLNYGIQAFPVQAPLPITSTAPALAFLSFLRSFAGVWGVTLGGAILQNELKQRLPASFLEEFPQGVAIAYSAIPQIPNLPQPLKDEIRHAFADSLRVIWKVLAGVCGAGLLSTLLMRDVPLHTVNDEKWALQQSSPSTKGNEDVSPLE